MRAELLSGLVVVGAFAAVLGVGVLSLELLGPRPVVYLAAGGLGTGNLGAPWWTYHSFSGE